MSRQITIEISDEIYSFLESRSDDEETVEMIAAEYLEQGISIEQTLRQQ